MAAYRKAGIRLLTGVEELDRKLEQLKIGAANKIARPALNKAARALLKRLKAGVPTEYKAVKKLLGSVVDTKGGSSRNQQRAKVGAGVGKTNKIEATRSGRNKGGVGIGGRNIHWVFLGTGERTQKKTGKATGIMKPLIPGLIANTATQFKSEMKSIIQAEVSTRLAALAQGK